MCHYAKWNFPSSCESEKLGLVLRATGVAAWADGTAVRYIGLEVRVVGMGVLDNWLLVRTVEMEVRIVGLAVQVVGQVVRDI
jgi:hypothetical protein